MKKTKITLYEEDKKEEASMRCSLLHGSWDQILRRRPSVRPSVRPSRLPCPLCNIYSSGWILSILATNDHYHERVCHTQWPWPWPISSRSFGLDLENCVRSVASTVLDGFFLYLAQMITIIRGCVACYVFFRIWKFEFLANFPALPLKKKIYSSRWILSIFSTNDH